MLAERSSSLLDAYDMRQQVKERDLRDIFKHCVCFKILLLRERKREGNDSHPLMSVNFASAPTCRHRPSDAQDASLCLKGSLATILTDIYGTTW